ncbi:MAG: hydrogenase small subunit [bacterium]
MARVTRRKFLHYCGSLAAILGLGPSAVPAICQALDRMAAGRAPLLWLQGQSCSGCSVSLLNSTDPGPAQILTYYISLVFHPTLSAATGHTCLDIINSTVNKGGYILIVEGSVPTRIPAACMVGEEPMDKLVIRAARKASAVVALGTCASFGGIPAAENNPTGAMGVPEFLSQISTPVISLPGCPPHPDWLIGTLVHVLKFGLPALDESGRPAMFYGKVLHDQCPRFADYEREKFAKTLADDGCLFRLGCMGPNAHADCSLRLWNSRTSFCIKAGAPCIGCTSPEFAAKASFPFYRKRELLPQPVKEDNP